MTPTNNPHDMAAPGAAPALWEACPIQGCLYGKGHRVDCAFATGNRPRRCRGCNEAVGDQHRLGCLYSEPDGIVENFDCQGDA